MIPSSHPTRSSGKWIDLTLPLREGIRGFAWEPKYTLRSDGWNARMLHIYSHAGTHMDAPLHFEAGPGTIDTIPLSACGGTACVAQLTDIRPEELITVQRLGDIGRQVAAGDALLLSTGWSRWVDESRTYRDRLPRVSAELAEWCVERKVQVLGVETPSVARIEDLDELTRVHRVLLGGGVTIVEGLCNLTALPPHGAWFMAAPLLVAGSDGAPCRAFAIVPD